jgi:Cysteine-rich secretory protein family
MRNRTAIKNRYRLSLLVILSTAIATNLVSQPTLAATEPEWLTVLNLYRASARLGAVTEDPTASSGSVAHSQYLLQNRVISHGEDSGKPGYSAEGVRGGETGNVATGSGAKVGQRETIEGWMTAPFHGLAMIEPNSQRFGYGLATSGMRWASTLSHSWDAYQSPSDVGDGPLKLAVTAVQRTHPDVNKSSMEASQRGINIVVDFSGRRFVVIGETVRELKADEPPFATVVWPADTSAVPLVRYAGSEWPDPITACKGWTSKAGLPILIHRSVPTAVISATVTDTNGTPQQVCPIDSESYTNPNPADEKYASGLLEMDAIIIPKNPLIPGHSYKVHVELNDEVLDWTFGTTTDGSIKLPAGSPLEGTAMPGVAFQPVTAQQAKTAVPTKSASKPKPAPKKSKAGK